MGREGTVTTTWRQDTDLPQESAPFLSKPKSKSKTWRNGALACAAASSVVFILNLAVTIYLVTSKGRAETDGRHTLYTGDCKYVSRLNTALHLIINALSTILLGASNYCMQCLSAPTRMDIDKAHGQKRWLDVGILSFRNLRRISKRKALLWWLLGVSSFPLHLFYNSAVFSTVGSHRYWPILVTRPFAEQAQIPGFDSYDTAHLRNQDLEPQDYDYIPYEAVRLRNLHLQGQLERLNTLQCINAYARQYQTRGSVLLVADNNTIADVQMNEVSYLEYVPEFSWDGGSDWMCQYREVYMPCELRVEIQRYRANVSTWRPLHSTAPITYCLSERLPDVCKVQCSLQILIIVVVINVFKAALMFYIAFATREDPLLTVGDAVASFLKEPDTWTAGMCLASKEDFKKQARGTGTWPQGASPYIARRQRMFASADKMRWYLSITLYVAVLGAICGFLAKAAATFSKVYLTNVSLMLNIGLGTAMPLTMLGLPVPAAGASALMANVVIANAPQPILTFTYFTYNSLFTSMSLAREWASYSLKRKGLRLSSAPQGDQRSSYRLQLPYRVALPLMLLAGLVHWLASQSIFIAVVELYDIVPMTGVWERGQSQDDDDYSDINCGYSPLALLLMGILWLVMIVVLLVTASRSLKSAIPFAGSCSAAIAAACHVSPRENGIHTATSRIQWGVTDEPRGPDLIGHCAFSQENVRTPLTGEMYQ